MPELSITPATFWGQFTIINIQQNGKLLHSGVVALVIAQFLHASAVASNKIKLAIHYHVLVQSVLRKPLNL